MSIVKQAEVIIEEQIIIPIPVVEYKNVTLETLVYPDICPKDDMMYGGDGSGSPELPPWGSGPPHYVWHGLRQSHRERLRGARHEFYRCGHVCGTQGGALELRPPRL